VCFYIQRNPSHHVRIKICIKKKIILEKNKILIIEMKEEGIDGKISGKLQNKTKKVQLILRTTKKLPFAKSSHFSVFS